MKKVIIMIVLIACMILIFSGCNKTDHNANSLTFTFDKEGNYTGFSNIPTNYTIEDAKEDGYYIIQDAEVVANEKVWNNFIEKSKEKENSSVRIVEYFTEDKESPYFLDLFYNQGYYYLFDSSADNKEKSPYLYLLTLEGMFGNPEKKSGVVVLSNDNTLTFDMVMKSLTSSSTEEINKIPSYKLIMFQ